MKFISPAYLWALLGLSIPLAIHLLSRKEGKLIRIGSLRHIRETSSRQFRSIRINEYLLLLLRSMVVALTVLLMSGWYLTDLKDHRKWLLVEPGLENNADAARIREGRMAAGYEDRWLLPDFPSMEKPIRMSTAPDYSSRVEELVKAGVDSMVILSKGLAVGFEGARAVLPDHVQWITIPAATTDFTLIRALAGADSLFIRVGRSSAEETHYISRRIPKALDTVRTVEPTIGKPIRIVVAYDESFTADKQVMMAALKAIGKNTPERMIVQAIQLPLPANNNEVDWTVWLAPALPEKHRGNVLYFADRVGAALIVDERPGVGVITTRLNSEVAVKGNLAAQLMKRIVPSAEARKAARTADVRSLDERSMWKSAGKTEGVTLPERSNETSTRYLLIALLVFVVTERIVSFARNQ